jgi:hypothetical protein
MKIARRRNEMHRYSGPTGVLAIILVLLAIGLVEPGNGFAAFFTFTPTDDAFVYNQTPAANYGSDTTLSVFRRDSYDQTQRVFFKFDVSSLPADETVVAATLHVYAYGFHTFGPLDTALHFVSNDAWSENTLTWNNMPAYDNKLDLKELETWNYVYPIGTAQWGVWNLFGLGGDWVQGGGLSDGALSLLLKVDPESGNRSGEQFNSSEFANPALRPYLTVETQLIQTSAVPLPPSLFLLTPGLVGIAAMRRKLIG